MPQTPKPQSPLRAFLAKFKQLPLQSGDQSTAQYKALMSQSVKDGKIHPELMLKGDKGETVM